MSHACTSICVRRDTHRVPKPTPDDLNSTCFRVPFLHTILGELGDRTFVLLELTSDTNHREAEFVSDRGIEIEVIAFVRECRFTSTSPTNPCPSRPPADRPKAISSSSPSIRRPPSTPPNPTPSRTSSSTSPCPTSPTTEGLPPAVYPHKLSHRPPRPAPLNIPTSHSTFRASPTRGSAATACSLTRPTPLLSPSHSPTHHPSRVHTAVESPIRTGEGVGVDEDGNVYVAEGPASLSDAGSAFTKYVVAGM